MRSIQIEKVYEFASKVEAHYNAKPVNPNYKKYNRSVTVTADDGSSFHYVRAYVETYKNEDGLWYIIFSEHYDIQVIHADDVLLIEQHLPPIKIQKLRL